ncbi:MAG: hypothetical protein RIE08_13920 [Acidimicrobiales bacterium]
MTSPRDDNSRADATATLDAAFSDEPEERLSWTRLGAVVLIVGMMAGVGLFGFREATTTDPVRQRSWSVPYVDVTLTPTYEFQDPRLNPARDIALAFVVAHPDDACTPSWGGAYTLGEAERDLELDRRITQLRAAGGDVTISFGGQANDELAYVCADEDRLTDAYREVVERYDVKVIDLDIENEDIADLPSIERRARAIATIQAERRAGDEDLSVWITLPVSTGGLTADGVALVSATLAGGVDLAGVNAMTMNFSDPANPTLDMLEAAKSSLEASARQIGEIWADNGVELDEVQRWARLGATPMLGQNDVPGEVFTLEDARGLADFAVDRGLGRVSTWSLNRDRACPESFADVMILSNSCSGVDQAPLEFANVFTALPGRAPTLPQSDTVTVADASSDADDPATSPYPVWRPDAHYVEGYKVVREGLVYQAKWYTQGQDPGIVTDTPWDSPWSLLGPVSPDEPPFTPSTLPAGTHPSWEPATLFDAGDVILFDGLPYRARWPNQNEVPSVLFPVPPDSAWEPLFEIPGDPTSS